MDMVRQLAEPISITASAMFLELNLGSRPWEGPLAGLANQDLAIAPSRPRKATTRHGQWVGFRPLGLPLKSTNVIKDASAAAAAVGEQNG
jgi:hypothetical protein